MSLSRFDDGALWHPKAVEAGEDAANLWMRSILYANRYSTDGLIRTAAVAGFTSKPPKVVAALIASLVTARLWDVEPGVGWRIHDFLDWNDSRDEKDRRADEISAKRSAAGKAGNAKRWGAKVDRNAIANPSQTDRTERVATIANDRSVPYPSVSVPSPYPTEGEESSERAEHAAATATVQPVAKVKPPKASDAPEAPPVDPAARAVFDAIVADPMLAPITRRPADLATRLVAPGAFPGVNVLGQVLRAAAWNAGQRKPKRDGRAFLLGWLGRSDPEAPQPLGAGAANDADDDANDPWAKGLAALPPLPPREAARG